MPSAKAAVNIVMALASFREARSVVELSLSPIFHYQYSSISKTIHRIGTQEPEHLQRAIGALCMGSFEAANSPLLLQSDTTPVCKPHAPTLKDRTYVAVPNNVIAGNKSLNVGYDVSFVNLCDQEKRWSLPLSIQRVPPEKTASACALEQIARLLCEFDDQLVINTLDSKYGNAAYLGPAYAHENLVNVVRLKTGMKVWKEHLRRDTGGAPAHYGQKYYLCSSTGYKHYKSHPKTKEPYRVFRRSIFDLAADKFVQLQAKTRKGRKLVVHLWRWRDMLLRGKSGASMKEKPLDLLAVEVCDEETGALVFGRPMFLAISGERKTEVSTEQGYQCYRGRYGIEPYFRFCKQRLLLSSYQTCSVDHFDSWLLMVQLASWLLYSASEEVQFSPRKWEQYLPQSKGAQAGVALSMAQTRKGAERLFLTFESGPFKPGKYKKGSGRAKGAKQVPRKRYKVVKKRPTKTLFKHKTVQLE
jgi:hypothetical protein